MRIFVSHSSKDEKLANTVTNFLESLNTEIEVFCSSVPGAIPPGVDYVDYIMKQLNISDIFIPIISNNYYSSRFCMVELGFAYSASYNIYKDLNKNYIFPFSVYPINKSEALKNTPLKNLQVADIANKDEIGAFVNSLNDLKKCNIIAYNNKIRKFIEEINNNFIDENFDLINVAQKEVYFDQDNILIDNPRDFVFYKSKNNEFKITYDFNPYEKNNRKPTYISFVLKYIDKFDIQKYIELYNKSIFSVCITSETNSLNNIDIEFKYSNNNLILKKYTQPLHKGINKIEINMNDMRSEALRDISQICFVIHPYDTNVDKGEYKISDIELL